jgi:hypothetical protein
MSQPLGNINAKNSRKGAKLEASARKAIQAVGFPACRATLSSGQYSHLGIPELCGDLKLGAMIGGSEATISCKQRKNGAGFATLYQWLAEPFTDILWLKADRAPDAIVAMPASVFCQLLTHIPPDQRLEPPADRYAALRNASRVNPYAAAALRHLEGTPAEADPNEQTDTSSPPF